MLCNVTIHTMGKWRKIDTSALDVANMSKTAKDELLKASVNIFDTTERMENGTKPPNPYQDLCGYLSDLRQWLSPKTGYWTLPAPTLKDGIYMVPVCNIKTIEDALIETRDECANVLVPAFEAVYEKNIAALRAKLKDSGVFERLNIPTLASIKNRWGVTWQWSEVLTSADTLKGIDMQLFEKEMEKRKEMMDQAMEAGRAMLRAAMLEFTEHLVEQCRPSQKGEGKRRFSGSWLEKVDDFAAAFDARNITNDAQLKTLVLRAKEITRNVSPEDLRDDEVLRAKIKAQMEKLKTDIAAGMTDASKRAISIAEGIV